MGNTTSAVMDNIVQGSNCELPTPPCFAQEWADEN